MHEALDIYANHIGLNLKDARASLLSGNGSVVGTVLYWR